MTINRGKFWSVEIEFAETHGPTTLHMDGLCEPKKEKRHASSR